MQKLDIGKGLLIASLVISDLTLSFPYSFSAQSGLASLPPICSSVFCFSSLSADISSFSWKPTLEN